MGNQGLSSIGSLFELSGGTRNAPCQIDPASRSRSRLNGRTGVKGSFQCIKPATELVKPCVLATLGKSLAYRTKLSPL